MYLKAINITKIIPTADCQIIYHQWHGSKSILICVNFSYPALTNYKLSDCYILLIKITWEIQTGMRHHLTIYRRGRGAELCFHFLVFSLLLFTKTFYCE